MSKRGNPIQRAAEAHTNLTTFGSIISVLEGGSIYGGSPRTDRAVSRIIRTCKDEQKRLINEYDDACAEAQAPTHPDREGKRGER